MKSGLKSVGIDVGGTKIAAGLFSSGRLLDQATTPTPATDLGELVRAIAELCKPWLGQADTIGLCTPGYLDPLSGRVRFASNLPALTGVDLAGELLEATGRPVLVGNDADAATLAEYRLGAARDWHSAFYLTVSTGIGGGFIGPAGLLRGHSGAASEVGHLCVVPGGHPCGCGARGCLEAHASGSAIAQQASLLKQEDLTSRQVFALASKGDSQAEQVVTGAVTALARGLAAVVQLLDPQGLVLGGGVAVGNSELLPRVRAALADQLFNREMPQMKVAELGADAGVIGAALLPLEPA